MTDELANLLASVEPPILGGRIRQARLKVDITQGQLAGDNASVGYISRIESGKRRPEIGLLEAIARRLGTTAYALLSGAPDPTESRIRVALDHAELALRGGDVDEADRLLEDIRPDMERSPDPAVRRTWLLTQALVLEAHGKLDESISKLEDLVADGSDVTEKTRAAIALSRCYRESGDFSRAIATGEDCLDSLKSLGLDGSDDAVQLFLTVAAAHFTLGDVGHAVRLCRRAIERAEEGGSPVARASAYWNASIMESRRGDTAAAVPLAEKALQLFDFAESNRNLARLRSQLGIFQLRLDPPDADAAIANLESAEKQFSWSSASPVDKGRNNVALAKARLLQGSPEDALSEAQAVHLELEGTAPLLDVGALTVMGQATFELGDSERAAHHYRQAVALLTGIGADRAAAECWFELGVLLDDLGLRDEAHDAFRSSAAATGIVSLAGLRQQMGQH